MTDSAAPPMARVQMVRKPGTLPGLCSFVLGLLSLAYLALVLAPVALLLGSLGLWGGVRSCNLTGITGSLLGIGLAVTGLLSSPWFFLLLAAVGFAATAPTPPQP